MREIKFRQWDGARFHEWGMIDGSFIGPSAGLGIRGVIGPFNPTTTPHQQFTGLRDVNGVEIYEGDILKMWYAPQATCVGVAEFKNGCFLFVTKHAHPAESPLHDCVNLYANEFRIIGNIYENLELLK